MSEPTPTPTEPVEPEPALVDQVLADAESARQYWVQMKQEALQTRDRYQAEIDKVQQVIDLCNQFKRLYENARTRLAETRVTLDEVRLERNALRGQVRTLQENETRLVDIAYERAAVSKNVPPDAVWSNLGFPPPAATTPPPAP